LFPGPRCSFLPRGSGMLSGRGGLLCTIFIVVSPSREPTSCPWPTAAHGSVPSASTSHLLRPAPWRRPSASGRAASTLVICRPSLPPFERRRPPSNDRRQRIEGQLPNEHSNDDEPVRSVRKQANSARGK